jgi:hypothetical protein
MFSCQTGVFLASFWGEEEWGICRIGFTMFRFYHQKVQEIEVLGYQECIQKDCAVWSVIIRKNAE